MTIPIVYSVDEKFSSLCSVSILSLINTKKKNDIYIIYILFSNLTTKTKKKLLSISENIKNVEIKLINIKDKIDYDKLFETSLYTYEIYYRLYAPIIINHEKIIYLDSDTIVLDDISKLYNEDIKDYILGAVLNFNYFRSKTRDYNSGVLLINKNEYLKNDVYNKCLNKISNKKYKLPDQDAINEVCFNKIKTLPIDYNYQMDLAQTYIIKRKINYNKKPIIVHFSYNTKPINYISKYSNEFWKIAKKSPFYDEMYQNYIDNSYNILMNSDIDEAYLTRIREGKIGLKGIIKTTYRQFINWYYFKKEKKNEKNSKKNITRNL